jgi:hypothetical protein
MNWIYGVLGGLLMAVTVVDFVYTTLSSNGSGKITSWFNSWLGRILVPPSDRTRVWVGAIHLVYTMLVWISLLLVAGFLCYMSQEDWVVNSSSKAPATLPQRAYVTAFVFSTLGTGDYVPGTDVSRYFTAFFSILGFGVLTTAITYIINVMTAANNKKAFAAYVSSMGYTPTKLYSFFTTSDDASLFTERIDDLVQLLDVYTNNHLCYPIVHYFISDKEHFSATLQLASLHEATYAMRIRYQDDAVVMAHLDRVDRVMNRFLDIARTPESFKRDEEEDLLELRRKWNDYLPILTAKYNDTSDNKRRLGALLRQFGYDWEKVYVPQD